MLAIDLGNAGVALDTSEKKLVDAAKCGDMEAFGILFERHKDAVYSFAVKSIGRREDAEDITQETFCRAWRSIRSFRGDSKLLTWLYRITANLCVDLARSKIKRTCSMTELGLKYGEDHLLYSSVDVESESITRQTVNNALSKLNMNHRMLVVLCEVQGFTHEEAAKILGCSSISVRVKLSRARKKLRKLLSAVLEEVE